MLVYGELKTFTRMLFDNNYLICDLGIMAIVYYIWNRVKPPALSCEISGALHLPQPGLMAGWLAGKLAGR